MLRSTDHSQKFMGKSSKGTVLSTVPPFRFLGTNFKVPRFFLEGCDYFTLAPTTVSHCLVMTSLYADC